MNTQEKLLFIASATEHFQKLISERTGLDLHVLTTFYDYDLDPNAPEVVNTARVTGGFQRNKWHKEIGGSYDANGENWTFRVFDSKMDFTENVPVPTPPHITVEAEQLAELAVE